MPSGTFQDSDLVRKMGTNGKETGHCGFGSFMTLLNIVSYVFSKMRMTTGTDSARAYVYSDVCGPGVQYMFVKNIRMGQEEQKRTEMWQWGVGIRDILGSLLLSVKWDKA